MLTKGLLKRDRILNIIATGLTVFFISALVGNFAMLGTNAFAATGSTAPTEQQEVAVLTLHASEADPSGKYIMSLAELQKTFQALKDNGFHPISLEQFHAFIDNGATVPERAVLLTFDDGYRDVYENVFPLTKRYNYPAVSFAVTKWFDRYPRPEISREHLTVDEAGELLGSGLWQIGGHSYDGHRVIRTIHNQEGPFLVTLGYQERDFHLESEGEYQARVWQDISMNTAVLKLVGVKEAQDFAFPYGAYDDNLVKMLNEAGYKYLYTNEPGLNNPGQDPSAIRRINAAYTAKETIEILERYFKK